MWNLIRASLKDGGKLILTELTYKCQKTLERTMLARHGGLKLDRLGDLIWWELNQD